MLKSEVVPNPADDHPVVVLTDGRYLEGHCPPRTARNLFWNWTEPGRESVQPCPPSTSFFARWRCGLGGKWEASGPDMSGCQSLWLSRLESRMHGGSSIDSIGAEMAALTETKDIYGGDIPVVTGIIQGLVHRLRQDIYVPSTREEKEMKASELLQNVLKTASNLLDEALSEAWNDVSQEQRSTYATSLILGVEEIALLLAESINNEKNLIEATNNILSSIRVMRKKSATDQLFPTSDSSRWTGEEDSVLLRVPAATLSELGQDGAVKIVFTLYNNLERILPGKDTRFVNSRILGATSSKGRELKVTRPLQFTLGHLETNVRGSKCASWDYAKKKWSYRDCSVVASNSTHTQCRCKKVSVYAVLSEEASAVSSLAPAESEDELSSSKDSKAAAEPHGSATTDATELDRNLSTIIAVVVALVAVIAVLIVAAILARRFDLKPRMQKFVQAGASSSGSGGSSSGGSGGGVFRCKKSESSTSSCGFYPPLTSSPTSTNVSSGTPTNQTTYLEQVLKAHGLPSEQAGEFQQVRPQTAGPQTATIPLQQQDLPGGGTIYRPVALGQQQQLLQSSHQLPSGRHLVALNQYDPFGHHIYMEIDPVYARLDAAVAAAAAAAAAAAEEEKAGASRLGNHHHHSSSSNNSDIQLSDMSDDDPVRQQRHQQQQQRLAEERPLIRRSADLLSQQQLDREGNLIPSASSPVSRQFLTSQRLQQHREKQNIQGGNNNNSLRGARGAGQHQRPRLLQHQQQPLLLPVSSSSSQLEDPISIALQGGEQFVSLKIDPQRRQQKRQNKFDA